MGGGNRFSMLNTLEDAYKVGMLNNTILDGSIDRCGRTSPRPSGTSSAGRGRYYSITLGGAQALYSTTRWGTSTSARRPTSSALDWTAGPPATAWHSSLLWDGSGVPSDLDTVGELLFSIMMVGDERSVAETWVAGERLYQRP